MSIEDAGTPHEKLSPDVRVSVALKLRKFLQDWVGLDVSRSQIATPIWNDLMAADIRDEDKDADKALDSATKQMDNNGIITPQELEVVIAESRAEHEL